MATAPVTPITSLKVDHSQVFKDISKLFTLKRSSRWLIFTVFLLFNVSMNMDNGTINCAAKEMGNYFFSEPNKLHNNETGNPVLGDLNSSHNKEMGFFKCVVFLGTTCGSIISAFIINKVNRKYFLMSSAILNGCCLFLFYLDIKPTFLYFLIRFCTGIFQSFVSIYLPAWCNQFGIKAKRTIMLGLVQMGVPLGVVLGYGITDLNKRIHGKSRGVSYFL